jgi:hypothetical protein
VNTLRVGAYTAGDVVLLASDVEHSATNIDQLVNTIMKKFTAGRDGTYRFTYDVRIVTSAQGNCHFYLQKDYSSPGLNYLYDFYINIGGAGDSGWYSVPTSEVIDVAMVAGQEIFLIAYGMSTVTAYAKNFRMKVSAKNEVSAPVVNVA